MCTEYRHNISTQIICRICKNIKKQKQYQKSNSKLSFPVYLNLTNGFLSANRFAKTNKEAIAYTTAIIVNGIFLLNTSDTKYCITINAYPRIYDVQNVPIIDNSIFNKDKNTNPGNKIENILAKANFIIVESDILKRVTIANK